jgi:3-oxoacyl-ACP reductase-like protein
MSDLENIKGTQGDTRQVAVYRGTAWDKSPGYKEDVQGQSGIGTRQGRGLRIGDRHEMEAWDAQRNKTNDSGVTSSMELVDGSM